MILQRLLVLLVRSTVSSLLVDLGHLLSLRHRTATGCPSLPSRAARSARTPTGDGGYTSIRGGRRRLRAIFSMFIVSLRTLVHSGPGISAGVPLGERIGGLIIAGSRTWDSWTSICQCMCCLPVRHVPPSWSTSEWDIMGFKWRLPCRLLAACHRSSTFPSRGAKQRCLSCESYPKTHLEAIWHDRMAQDR